jgi:DNA invertase Pin-like site-specific DNA recombinase
MLIGYARVSTGEQDTAVIDGGRLEVLYLHANALDRAIAQETGPIGPMGRDPIG